MSDGQRTREEVLEDINAHPEKHHHSMCGLISCCCLTGEYDGTILDAHSVCNIGLSDERVAEEFETEFEKKSP